ncbi:MAG: hypothetical protein QOD06_2101, partial [Candidatus Binatota bacterium]|nr:hypothetical protein [Candidatus Binatota bacterium]
IDLESGKADFHYAHAVALESLYDVVGAGKSYSRAVELDPQNTAYREAADRIRAAIADAAVGTAWIR